MTHFKHARLLGVLLLLVGFACWWVFLRENPTDHPQSTSKIAEARIPAASAERMMDEQAVVAIPAAVEQPIEVPAEEAEPQTHDHHHIEGNCAHCIEEEKLTIFRAEYANLRMRMLADLYEIDAASEPELRSACVKLADKVIRRWSFTDSKPLLLPEQEINLLEATILHPLTEKLTPLFHPENP